MQQTGSPSPRKRLASLLAGSALALAPLTLSAAWAADLPAPPASGNILDAADLLTDEQEQNLNKLIDQKNQETDRARLAIYTTKQDPGDLPDYATQLGSAWGVGDAGADNGLLLVIDMEGRETFLAVADGAGQYVSDSEARTIAQEVLGPYLTEGKYAAGLEASIGEVYQAAQSENEEAEDGLLIAGIVATLGTVSAMIGAAIYWDYRKVKRAAEEEMRQAQAENPGLSIPEDMHRDYIKYRYANRTAPANLDEQEEELAEEERKSGESYTRYAPSFNAWLPLYLVSPQIYAGDNHLPASMVSAGSGSSFSSGSSFGGGGGFSGGGGGGRF